jgi:hypothetical protein
MRDILDDHDASIPPSATNPSTFVTKHWIQAVYRTTDTPLRTHRITLSYSKFAAYLDHKLFGEGSVGSRMANGKAIVSSNANWFNFATWGTYTLGPNIRNDGAPQRLETLPNSIRRRVAPSIVQSRSADGELVGRALAWGQELIFLSAGKALLHFKGLDGPGLTRPFETPKADRDHVLDALNWSGQQWIDEGHLDLIDDGFECFRLVLRRAAHLRALAGNPDKIDDEIQADPYVAKLLFLATCLLTAAEQDVVNRALAVVIDSVPARVLKTVDGRLSRLAHWRRGVPEQVAAYDLLARLNHAEIALSDTWARLMTRYLLVIVLPTEILQLGRDVPLRSPTGPMFPAPLMNVAVDGETYSQYGPAGDIELVKKMLRKLKLFVGALDRSQAGVGSAARDWRRFDDRMNWAISLFRSRQQDSSLYWPPYSVEDTRKIVGGEMPRASGHPGHGSVMPPLDPAAITDFLGRG